MYDGRLVLAVPRLQCASVLEQLKSEAPSRVRQVAFGGKPVEAASVDDLLYVPMLRLQVWRDRIVPHEANTDAHALEGLLALTRDGQSIAHALFTGVEERQDDVCILSNISSYDLYHYVEELYKVVILERAGFTGTYILSRFPTRSSQDRPQFCLEFLDLLGIARDRIIDVARPTVFRSAWLVTRITHADTPAHADLFGALRSALAATAGGHAAGLRLWLEWPQAPLTNREEVCDALLRHGFSILNAAALSAGQLIAAATCAEVLGGAHSPALVYSMFLPPRSTVIECFAAPQSDYGIMPVLNNLQHRYLQMTHPEPAADPPRASGVAVDCEHLRNILNALSDTAR